MKKDQQAITKNIPRKDIVSKPYTLADLTLFKEKKTGIYEYSCYAMRASAQYFFGIVLFLLNLVIVVLSLEFVENTEYVLVIIGAICFIPIMFLVLFRKVKTIVDRNTQTICLSEFYGLFPMSYSTEDVTRFKHIVESRQMGGIARGTRFVSIIYMYGVNSARVPVLQSEKDLQAAELIKDLEILTDIANNK